MEDEEAINELKNFLVTLTDDIDEFRGFARDAHLDIGLIDFKGSARRVCHNVVQRAKIERRLSYLIDAVLRFTKDDPRLVEIKRRLPNEETGSILSINPVPKALLNPPEPSTKIVKFAPKLHRRTNPLSTLRLTLFHTLFTSKNSLFMTIILLIVILYTAIKLILSSLPLLTISLLNVLFTIMMLFEIFIIALALLFILLLFLIRKKRSLGHRAIWLQWTYRKLQLLNWYWMRAIIVILLVSMPINLFLSISFQTKIQSTIISSDNSPYTGLCDGRCALDIDRLDGSSKSLAASGFKNQHRKAACGYLDLARNEEQTDAEAKIYYEDQCSGSNRTPLSCPCISYVAAIALAQERKELDTSYNDPALTDPTLYNNGVSRSILQAVYLQQKEWNDAHKNGPAMYVFVANVGDVSDIQHASQWQQKVAQQIIFLQQTDNEHHIYGVVGLSQRMDSFLDVLDKNAIPMVSIDPLSSDNSQDHLHLLSIVPTPELEMSADASFLVNNIMQNKHNIDVGIFYYRHDMSYQTMINTFKSKLPSDYMREERPYDGLPQNTSSTITQLAINAAHAYDAIFFVGPVNDLLTFITTLRKTDKITPVIASSATYQFVYKYQPDAVKMALQGLYFTAFAYHDIKNYADPSNKLSLPISIIDTFQKTYDPESSHGGNIYTYQLPTSDALVAFDAMGVFTHLIEHYGIKDRPYWQDQQTFLVNNPPTMVSGNITFAATGSTPKIKTVLLLQVRSGGIFYLHKMP